MEPVAGEHLRPERFAALDSEGSLAGLDRGGPDRVEDPATPAESVGQGPGEGGEVIERWDAEQAHPGPWSGGEDRIEKRLKLAAEPGRAVQALEVVDTDRDEHQVSVEQGVGTDQAERPPCGGTGHRAGLQSTLAP